MSLIHNIVEEMQDHAADLTDAMRKALGKRVREEFG